MHRLLTARPPIRDALVTPPAAAGIDAGCRLKYFQILKYLAIVLHLLRLLADACSPDPSTIVVRRDRAAASAGAGGNQRSQARRLATRRAGRGAQGRRRSGH